MARLDVRASGSRAEDLRAVLASIFADGHAVLASGGLGFEVLEVSWTEHRRGGAGLLARLRSVEVRVTVQVRPGVDGAPDVAVSTERL